MYLNCKHEVRECDRYVMFDLDLSNSASDFKTIYEERFPHQEKETIQQSESNEGRGRTKTEQRIHCQAAGATKLS